MCKNKHVLLNRGSGTSVVVINMDASIGANIADGLSKANTIICGAISRRYQDSSVIRRSV